MAKAKKKPEQAEIDVLIVGGGIQGLWLLNDLRRVGYRVILLERCEIGGIQTLHSHGFLHLGYGYTNVEMARRLRATEGRWTNFLAKNQLRAATAPALYGFTSLANSSLWQDKWKQAELGASVFTTPQSMQRGLLRKVFNTKEKWLDTSLLTRTLASGVEDAIFHGEVQGSEFDPYERRVLSACLTLRERELNVRPRVVVLAAGAGNYGLLQMLNDLEIQNQAQGNQQLRESLMLVIKGNGHLPELALVVPDLWLFIVSRRDKNGDVVWLASHDVDPRHEEHGSLSLNRSRIQDNIAALFAVLPQIFSRENVRKMHWAAYTGLKAEAKTAANVVSEFATNRTIIPSEWVIESFGSKNVYAVWPTKLTLAPASSQALTLELLDRFDPPASRDHQPLLRHSKNRLNYGAETWTQIDLKPWKAFKSDYDIKHRT